MQKTETESVKTEQPVKTNFKEVLPLLKSENSKLMKVAYLSEDHSSKLADFSEFLTERPTQIHDRYKSVSAQKSKSSINLLLETLLGTTLQ